MNKAIPLLLVAFQTSAFAQGIPVIDATSNVNQLRQIVQTVEQLAQLKAQLRQLETSFNSMNGIRGFGDALNTLDDQLSRRYLPSTAKDLRSAAKGGSGSNSGLQQAINNARRELSKLPPGYYPDGSVQLSVVQASIDSLATDTAVGQSAYGAVEDRIRNMERLIASLGMASDPKTTSELQARISAEQVLVQNEQTKLAALAYMQKTDEQAARLEEQKIIQSWSTNQLPPLKY